jgi:light-harvesting complex 1 beta chain
MIQQQSHLMSGFGAGGARASIVLFAMIFIVFFVIAAVAQVLMLKWRPWLPGSEGEASFFNSVRSSVYTVMSYIS